jgi:hypothetical protein
MMALPINAKLCPVDETRLLCARRLSDARAAALFESAFYPQLKSFRAFLEK